VTFPVYVSWGLTGGTAITNTAMFTSAPVLTATKEFVITVGYYIYLPLVFSNGL
jgi:hypothetical protein